MDRGHDREAVFADDEDRSAFLGLVARYRDRFGFRLYHYCLMTNHFHLLVQLHDPRHVQGCQVSRGLGQAPWDLPPPGRKKETGRWGTPVVPPPCS
jgi:hypothetical protein